jgi:hypothetical protein
MTVLSLINLTTLILFAGCQSSNNNNFTEDILRTIPDSIVYAKNYGGHLQGMTTDYQSFLFWSHTTQLVKTDLKGNILKIVDVPSHHGDLDYYKGKIYVAVNFGKFNEESGLSDSWLYIYNADNLDFVSRHPLPEVVHGAGGIAIHNEQIMVVGGLPNNGKYNNNFVYEYDTNFVFKKRHIIESGYTYLGIQTASYFNEYWYFGCYPWEETPKGKLLKVNISNDSEMKLDDTFDIDMSFGIIGLEGNKFFCSCSTFNSMAKTVALSHSDY